MELSRKKKTSLPAGKRKEKKRERSDRELKK